MILLLDKNEELSRSIECYDITRTRELNGENTLETESNEEILEGDRILFKDELDDWNEYIISSVDIERDSEVKYIAYGEDSSYELFYSYVDDLKPRNENAKTLLGRLLENTRFEVGFVEDVGSISTNFYHTNVRNCIYRMVEILGCDINYTIKVKDNKIVARYVNLYKKIGSNNGKRFTYRKDLNNIKKTIDYSKICSKLYGYGKGEEIVDDDYDITADNSEKDPKYGRRINFADVNGGRKYVENNDTRLKYGIGLERKHLEGVFIAEDCEDKEELLRLTKEELEKRSKPKISYDINVEDISKYQDMGGIVEGVGLGDEVLISDKSINEKVLTRVIKIVDHPFTGEDIDITLGNYFMSLTDSIIETEKLRQLIERRDRLIGEEIKRLATMTNKGFLRSVADRLNRELNDTDGFVYFIPNKGIRIYDKPIDANPTKCIELGGGHLRIANKKLANGEFDFTTFGTGDGFTASLIVAGILKGGKVEFDLENGTFLIGNSINDFTMYWDGKTLKLRNVDIDLSNNSQIANIENNIGDINTSLNNQNQEIISMKSDFKVNLDGMKTSFEKRVKGVEDDVSSRDSGLRSYIQTNYSTKTQTADLIETKVSSINSRLGSAESRITQTSNKIDSEISSVKSTASSNYNALSSRISQTDSKVESRVTSSEARSIFRQEASSFTFDADQVNFNSEVSIKGTFESGNYGQKTRLADGKLMFYDDGVEKGRIGYERYYDGYGINIKSNKSMYLSADSQLSIGTEKSHIEIWDGAIRIISGDDPYVILQQNHLTLEFGGGWRMETTYGHQSLMIKGPNGKQWYFDEDSGFYAV